MLSTHDDVADDALDVSEGHSAARERSVYANVCDARERVTAILDHHLGDSAKLKVQSTLLQSAKGEVAEVLDGLVALIPPDKEVEDYLFLPSNDVLALRHYTSDLKLTLSEYREKLSQAETAYSQLFARLNGRDAIIDTIRGTLYKEVCQLRQKLEGKMAVAAPTETNIFRTFTDLELEIEGLHKQYGEELERTERSWKRQQEKTVSKYERLLKVKEKELLGKQLEYRNTTMQMKVSQRQHVEDLKTENNRLRDKLESLSTSLTAQMEQEFAQRIGEKLSEVRSEADKDSKATSAQLAATQSELQQATDRLEELERTLSATRIHLAASKRKQAALVRQFLLENRAARAEVKAGFDEALEREHAEQTALRDELRSAGARLEAAEKIAATAEEDKAAIVAESEARVADVEATFEKQRMEFEAELRQALGTSRRDVAEGRDVQTELHAEIRALKEAVIDGETQVASLNKTLAALQEADPEPAGGGGASASGNIANLMHQSRRRSSMPSLEALALQYKHEAQEATSAARRKSQMYEAEQTALEQRVEELEAVAAQAQQERDELEILYRQSVVAREDAAANALREASVSRHNVQQDGDDDAETEANSPHEERVVRRRSTTRRGSSRKVSVSSIGSAAVASRKLRRTQSGAGSESGRRRSGRAGSQVALSPGAPIRRGSTKRGARDDRRGDQQKLWDKLENTCPLCERSLPGSPCGGKAGDETPTPTAVDVPVPTVDEEYAARREEAEAQQAVQEAEKQKLLSGRDESVAEHEGAAPSPCEGREEAEAATASDHEEELLEVTTFHRRMRRGVAKLRVEAGLAPGTEVEAYINERWVAARVAPRHTNDLGPLVAVDAAEPPLEGTGATYYPSPLTAPTMGAGETAVVVGGVQYALPQHEVRLAAYCATPTSFARILKDNKTFRRELEAARRVDGDCDADALDDELDCFDIAADLLAQRFEVGDGRPVSPTQLGRRKQQEEETQRPRSATPSTAYRATPTPDVPSRPGRVAEPGELRRKPVWDRILGRSELLLERLARLREAVLNHRTRELLANNPAWINDANAAGAAPPRDQPSAAANSDWEYLPSRGCSSSPFGMSRPASQLRPPQGAPSDAAHEMKQWNEAMLRSAMTADRGRGRQARPHTATVGDESLPAPRDSPPPPHVRPATTEPGAHRRYRYGGASTPEPGGRGTLRPRPPPPRPASAAAARGASSTVFESPAEGLRAVGGRHTRNTGRSKADGMMGAGPCYPVVTPCEVGDRSMNITAYDNEVQVVTTSTAPPDQQSAFAKVMLDRYRKTLGKCADQQPLQPPAQRRRESITTADDVLAAEGTRAHVTPRPHTPADPVRVQPPSSPPPARTSPIRSRSPPAEAETLPAGAGRRRPSARTREALTARQQDREKYKPPVSVAGTSHSPRTEKFPMSPTKSNKPYLQSGRAGTRSAHERHLASNMGRRIV
eukprot:TRINITY_DN15968_c0_g1_i1.p1 TRINITY_DN15968_c0_g1~~TRINITY_DN15968_c0_g1_i1.p1  ORF type:complete len:1447 (+),score=522.06 TRINITY_DN15968_c0_g1_i1:84-4424(+)